jgi:cytochrome P450
MLDAHPALPVRVPLHTEPMGVWASFRAAQRNVLELIPEIATRVPILSGRTGKRWHMLMDPDGLKQVLRDRVDDYPKSVVTKLILEPAIGDSLFVAEGAQWMWQRRTAAPVFSHRNVTALGPVMTAAADRSVARLDKAVGRAANLFDEMVTATFEVIADVTFSDGTGFDAPPWVPRPNRLMTGSAMRQTKRLADQSINARKAEGAKAPPDLLDLLMSGADPESGRQMTTAELRDNLLTFIVAGHETTALTLSWALYLCAFDPAVQAAAREEAQATLGDRSATVADLPRLPLVRRIVDEALRMYPPAAFLSRTATAADTLCGREVRPGDTVILPIYALHRHRLLWEDADAFRPDRFADPKAVPRFQYLPFGDGPRICIGASFALQEAVIVLATLLARFRFSLIPGKNPKPVMILTLRPEGGVWLKIDAAR